MGADRRADGRHPGRRHRPPEVDTPSIDEPTTISFRLPVTDSVGATDVNDVTVRVQPT